MIFCDEWRNGRIDFFFVLFSTFLEEGKKKRIRRLGKYCNYR